MKAIDEAEAQARLDEILEEAEPQPIVIRRQGRDQAVVVSVADYERLRLANTRSFFDIRKEIVGEASASGLTEEKLAEALVRRRFVTTSEAALPPSASYMSSRSPC